MPNTILITGCCSGIGKHLAESLNNQFNIIGIDINDNNISNIHQFYKVDCCDNLELEKIFKQIASIDIAINCAGIPGVRKSFDSLSAEEILEVFNKNTLSMFNCLKQEVKLMRSSKGGKIINMSSILAHIGIDNALTYSISKASISVMTKVIASENKNHNILVNSISPATIDTPLVTELNKTNPKDYTKIYPTGNMGSINDVESVVRMLINNNFMTGNDITLDGGLTNLFKI